ncbi:YqzL family protein [Paenibacillus thailandensis]|uniref:YqzL family protein n=1 Tax=Paenibacillus thailandensis TaxID=393250 RepID=A0ABW5QYY7_9BACL
MRNFSWKYFTLTGDVESFLLYKEVDRIRSASFPESLNEADAGSEPEDAAAVAE